MSKTTTATKATIKPKATFAAASFANLRAVAGDNQGDALRVLLADIDEDPDQPRTQFDQADLEAMADSIREHDVVQPITVRPAVNGRYMLVFGARRVRAAKLAGKADIPAVIRNPSPDDYAAQVIENQQRSNLSNSDLATAIAKLWEAGKTNKQIGAICSLKDYQVAAFRQAEKFPPELRARLDKADMRALYDLFRQWGKTPEAVIAALPDEDTFLTVTEARRIIGGITGKPTGSIVLDRQPEAEAAPVAAAEVAAMPTPAPAPVQVERPAPVAVEPRSMERVPVRRELASAISEGIAAGLSKLEPRREEAAMVAAAPTLEEQSEAEAGAEVSAAEEPTAATQQVTPEAVEPVFYVAGQDGQRGRLIVDRRAERAGYALVAYAEGVEEVDAAALRIVAIE